MKRQLLDLNQSVRAKLSSSLPLTHSGKFKLASARRCAIFFKFDSLEDQEEDEDLGASACCIAHFGKKYSGHHCYLYHEVPCVKNHF